MGNINLSDSPVGFLVLSKADWQNHDWLSKLQSGSDQDGDRAEFWSELTSDQVDALQQIKVQHRALNEDWQDAITCARASFPSRNWAIASWGWYDPIHLFDWPEFETRALIPNDWKDPDLSS